MLAADAAAERAEQASVLAVLLGSETAPAGTEAGSERSPPAPAAADRGDVPPDVPAERVMRRDDES